jgi:hypothetical protein
MVETEPTKDGWDGLPPDPAREQLQEFLDQHPKLCDCGFTCDRPSFQGGFPRCREIFYQGTGSALSGICALVAMFEGCRTTKVGALFTMGIKGSLEECLRGVHKPNGYVSEGEVIVAAHFAGLPVRADALGRSMIGISKKDMAIFDGSASAVRRRALNGLPPLWTGNRVFSEKSNAPIR